MVKKVFLIGLTIAVLSVAIVSATGSQEETASNDKVVIEFATFQVGTHVGAIAEGLVLAEFHELYSDEITLNIEELPSDDAYTNKMKILAAAKDLPDVVDGKNGLRALAVDNGQAVDLLPLLKADAEWIKYIGQGAMDYNMTENGKLFSVANARQMVGYFYNKEMFDAVGIKPAQDWDEFMDNCVALKSGGYTPLAMMTGENSWTTNLFLASMVGSDGEEGNKFMNTFHPETYETPEMIKALTRMKILLKDYSTADSLGAIYANAANNFCQEQAAMIANGPWMISDFSNLDKSAPGFAEKVDLALYPENSLLAQYKVGYTLCTADDTPDVQDASLKFLKVLTGKKAQEIFLYECNVFPATSEIDISKDFIAGNRLLARLIELSSDAVYKFQNFDLTAHASVVDAFGVYYPEMVFDKITPAEMAKKLTEAADKSK